MLLGDDADADVTVGRVTNQGANDDQTEADKSSDVAHGMTNHAETDTWFFRKKATASQGGAFLIGLSEGTAGLRLGGYSINDNTTKTISGRAYIETQAGKKSGAGSGARGANANIFAAGDAQTETASW